MPWIDFRKPECFVEREVTPLLLRDKVTARLRENPSLEVHFVTTNMRFVAFLIDRGSINYRPED